MGGVQRRKRRSPLAALPEFLLFRGFLALGDHSRESAGGVLIFRRSAAGAAGVDVAGLGIRIRLNFAWAFVQDRAARPVAANRIVLVILRIWRLILVLGQVFQVLLPLL